MTDDHFIPDEVAQFEADAAEAEAGYNVEFLRSRPTVIYPENWHPEGWGQIVQLRYPRDRVDALDRLARATGKTRSQALREATDAYLSAAA